MEEALTSKQIAEWEVIDRIDPIGSWREDYQMAFIVSAMTNLALSIHGKQGAQLTAPIDFMPNWDGTLQRGPKKQTVEEMISVFKDIATQHNKRIAREERLNQQKPRLKPQRPM